MYRELPISEERFAELREPLSDDAQIVMDSYLQYMQLGTEGLEADLEMEPEEETEEQKELRALLQERMADLSSEDWRALANIAQELQRGYSRRIKENEAYIDLGERGKKDFERALEIDPSVETMGDAHRLLKAHGITPETTEADLEVELEVPVEEGLIGPEEWTSMPSDEIPCDENGIPTRKAAPKGFGVPMPEGEEDVFLNHTDAEVMRQMVKAMPYEAWVGQVPEEDLKERDLLKEEMVDLFTNILDRPNPEQEVEKYLDAMGRKSYFQAMAYEAKHMPEEHKQGYVDLSKNKDTAAARRYRREVFEPAMKEDFNRIAEEYEQELIERGVFELVVRDGKEYFKPGPNYAEWEREMEAKREGGDKE